ncbi:uncharacterized protein ATNIH1004_008044 [Aspergillus tanneri]|nr:uncharacterized protein ATNIH1004_008044 [Aspergillus tanneri]KAA8646611.1 hypothetical protein ATNIH1004_008044 [Aspergillus tanneri]
MSSDAHISMGSMHAHVDKNAPVDEDCAAGVTRILDTWVPRIYVRKVIGSESAYSSIEESMVDYLCKLHQENREVRDIKRKVDRKLGTMAVRPGELAKMAYSGTKVAFMYPEFLR